MRPPKWTAEEDATAIRMAGEGLKHSAIGRALRRTKQGVSNRLCKLGVAMVRDDIWPQERIDYAMKRWGEGASAAIIAKELGCGLSRSAVLGALHRRGVFRPLSETTERNPLVGSHVSRTRRVHRPAPPKNTAWVRNPNPEPKPMPKLRTAPVEPRNVTLMERSDYGCKYPSGHDGEQHLFCDLPRDDDGPYCAEHHALCSTGAPPKKRADPAQLNTNGMAFDFRTRAA